MKTYSAAITVEFTAPSDATAASRQEEIARAVYRMPDVVYTDTIGPPECIEECDEPEET